jgi:hypothetical protein
MTPARFHLAPLGHAWQQLRQSLAAATCGRDGCTHARSLRRFLRRGPRTVLFAGSRYCIGRCLEHALLDAIQRVESSPQRAAAAHRIPLGLLLLQRQELTGEQLRQTLAAQRSAGRGKIGEWLQALGFATDAQITSALARQWSCPVLRVPFSNPGRIPQMPAALLDWFAMFPVDYVAPTATLHIAFSDRIDYTALYAIGQMLECRTEPCLVASGWLRQKLERLAEHHMESEIVFNRTNSDRVASDHTNKPRINDDQNLDCRMPSFAEFARSIRSYCLLTKAFEVRLVSCGPHLWARLFRPDAPSLDLILRSQTGRRATPTHSLPAANPAV